MEKSKRPNSSWPLCSFQDEGHLHPRGREESPGLDRNQTGSRHEPGPPARLQNSPWVAFSNSTPQRATISKVLKGTTREASDGSD